VSASFRHEPGIVEIAARYYGGARAEVDDWIDRLHALSEREEAAWRDAQDALAR
jgi:hypothetical protein